MRCTRGLNPVLASPLEGLSRRQLRLAVAPAGHLPRASTELRGQPADAAGAVDVGLPVGAVSRAA